MIIRPTADPHTVTLSLAVFGRRGGHMHARFTARYVVMHRGEDAVLEVRVTPRSIRKRRHLVDGLMVSCPEDQQRMVCDFLSWWPGDWQDDCYRFRAGAELDFLREGVPLLRDNSIQVSVEEGLRDIVSEEPMRLRLDVQVKGGWFFLGVQPTVGDTVVSGAALKAAASLGRSWVSVEGKAVSIPEEVDLALLADAADGVQAVPRANRDKIISALSLMRGCSIEADKADLLRQVMYTPSEDELPKGLNAKLMDYQVVGHKWLKEKLSIGTGGVLADDMGLGKEQPVSTPVLTPSGWRPIGSLKVGDQVIGSNGMPTTVIGVFPQGLKPVFRVGFNDGSSTLCGLEHLWAVQTPNDRVRTKKWRVHTLAEIRAAGLADHNGNRKWFIPMMKAARFERKSLHTDLDTYLLGALLANGSVTANTPQHHGTKEQRDELLKTLPHGVEISGTHDVTRSLRYAAGGKNPISEALKELGAYGSIVYDKSIPAECFTLDVEARLSLLQGLLDNDGCVAKDGITVEYNTVSPELAHGVVALVQSLGGVARMTTRIPTYTYLGEKKKGHVDHRIRISMPEGMAPFRVASKAARFRPRTKYPPARAIDTIEPAGESECVCIAVDAPDHLYVTEHYIVTHNTLQTISAIMAAIDFKPDYKVLVAAPTSLLFNWSRELERFAPSVAMDVLVWEGKNRKSYAEYLAKSRIIIVSYSTLRRDVAILGEIRFDLGVFDEAQNLKNADTASHKAVASLQCATRIALSGTPIENRLSDLHAVFAVACPGLLPPYEEFEERYAKPFREGRPEGLELMKNHVQPHILRRRKEDVLKDLPEKMVIDHYCEMTSKQAERYAEALAESRLERDNAPDASARAAVMLKVLTRLRQIATDPRLGDRTGQYRAEDSGKIQSLRTLMDVIDADDTNKVLIFSQWVESLELIRMELEKRGQKYSYLTGATSDRDIQCNQFQERREFRYFLISLHAGGVGLNLTAANFVINMDPWWNPAKEAQAFARAHRHGQTRPVTVYRMIAPGTIEDKIASMQEFKQALADGIIDDGALPQLSVRDMAALID